MNRIRARPHILRVLAGCADAEVPLAGNIRAAAVGGELLQPKPSGFRAGAAVELVSGHLAAGSRAHQRCKRGLWGDPAHRGR